MAWVGTVTARRKEIASRSSESLCRMSLPKPYFSVYSRLCRCRSSKAPRAHRPRDPETPPSGPCPSMQSPQVRKGLPVGNY